MSFDPSKFDHSQILPKSFDEDKKALRVLPLGTGNILEGISFDQIDAAYPDDVTEVYIYSMDMTVAATVTITYTDCSKTQILKVEKV